MPKLKVFRTPIGFHDAYVAAPSRVAALKAWGADSDLFAAGVAELVTDPDLSSRPLAEPGVVIKVSRGSAADHLVELKRSEKPRAEGATAKASPAAPARAMQPRPPRHQLDQAEARLEAAERGHEEALGAIDRRIARLHLERDGLEEAFKPQREKLERRRDSEERNYEKALARWRTTD